MNPNEPAGLSNFDAVGASPSVLSLVLSAPLMVQLVIAVLLIALVWSLIVIGQKWFQFAKARKEADKFEKVFWSGQALDELYQALSQRRNGGMASLFVVAMREWKRSTEAETPETGSRALGGVQERVEKVMNVAMRRDLDTLQRRLAFTSVVAAAAPFIGLFGLSWGLMAAFQGAANANASLGMLAPGIAQGLLALALGFLVAIPAKVFAAKFKADAKRYAHRLQSFSAEFSSILSRQLDRSV